MLHSRLVVRQHLARAAFGVRHEQCPCLALSVRPHRDVATLQAAGCLVSRVFRLLRELALATHALLAVFPCVIEVAQVDADAEYAADGEAQGCLQPLRERALADGINQEGERHESDDEEEVVAHLDVIAEHLHRREEAGHHDAQQVAAAIAQHHAADGGRDEAQRQELPDVTCLDDDEIVTAEGPQHGAEGCHPHSEVERPEHDVEAQKHHEDVCCISREAGQAKLIDALERTEGLRTAVAGAHLIGGHSAEKRIGPACPLTIVGGFVLFHLDAAADASGVVMPREDQPVADGTDEIHDADSHEEQDGQHIRKKLFPIHNC